MFGVRVGYSGFNINHSIDTDDVDYSGKLKLDIGAIYGGIPSVLLTAQCGPAAPSGSSVCDQGQANVVTEQRKLRNKADFLRWYPVLNLGVAVRF
jgi:hypothetical protein